MPTEFSKIHHDLNNKIAVLDASLSAVRIYLQRLIDAGDNADLRQKACGQLQEISTDMITAAEQMRGLIDQIGKR